MYSECISLSETIQKQRTDGNVLCSFSPETGYEVVASVLKPLEELVSGRSPASFLSTSEQVEWIMQVIGYGLTLPLSEKHLLQGCVNVYKDWLTALSFKKRSVPQPIIQNPNRYAPIIFNHLCSLFVPRDEPRLLEDHVELCCKVVEMVQALIGMKGLNMSCDSWESVFSFLLHGCNLVLAPPTTTPSLGTSLSDVLVHVLFTSWLRACQDSFPSPNLWKTLREFCSNWRHHYSVIDQWNQLMYSITSKVVYYLYGPKHLSMMTPLPPQDDDFRKVINAMPEDAVVQCWFRMLHTLGNPVDLLYPDIITSGSAFRDVETDQISSSVSLLPNIFHKTMKGVLTQVSLFLGNHLPESSMYIFPARSGSTVSTVGTSPGVRRKESSRSQFYTPSPIQHPVSKKESFYININPDKKASPLESEYYSSRQGIVGKPTGNTLLHIFGNWLFEAAVWEGQDQEGFPLRRKSHSSTTVISSAADMTRLKDGSHLSASHSIKQRLQDYESGRAEAFGALCMIFSSMPCGDDIMKVYLARFYHSMYIGLKYDPQICSGQVITRIIFMSSNILRKDLPGVNCLVLPFLTALEKILGVKKPPYKGESAPEKLRKASISLLLSILPLPLHFIHLNIPVISTTVQSGPKLSTRTFYSLRNRIFKLLFAALETESDETNIQMLLYALVVYLQDVTIYEQSLSVMIGKKAEGPFCELKPTITYKEDIELSSIFRQSIISAHDALLKRNITVTLAALELLAGLATLHFDSHTHIDCRDAVQWVCEFIEAQALEKPHLHSKNLHTSIVAAFKTLMVWVMEHPHLLAHESCLSWLLRVTEFGITGQFSKHEDGSVMYKEEKKARPISGRVKEIAEFMLYCVMEKFGSFPSPCGAAASGSLLTEEELIKRLKKTTQDKFKYYLIDNSMILGLLEGSFTDDEALLPTVTGIMRGPAGRQVWSLQMRQHPRSVNPSSDHLCSKPRPVPTDIPPPCPYLKRPPWPREADNEAMKLDGAIPDLDSTLSDQSAKILHQKICQLLENEKQQSDASDHKMASFNNSLEPPIINDTFDTARLFLNHLGLLSIDNMKVVPGSPSIAILDSSTMNFRSSLAALDRMSTRYCDSVFVLYCKKGQNRVEDILSYQQTSYTKPQEYLEFLHGLGWTVDPIKHPGFSGKLRPELDEGSRNIGASAHIPYRPFPYYADAINEIAFIQPILKQSSSNSTSSVRSVESSDSGQECLPLMSDSVPSNTFHIPQSVPMRSTAPTGSGVQESLVQADGDRTSKGNKGLNPISSFINLDSDTPKRRTAIPQDCAAIVVWLECYEDHLQFPIERMSKLLHKGYCKTTKDIIPTIFVHKLGSGLFQIATRSSSSVSGPLVDGMVVSRRSLSVLVRDTVSNLCFSHRLNNEGYSPPHVKRKRKIEDIGSQFSKQLTVSELYTELILNK